MAASMLSIAVPVVWSTSSSRSVNALDAWVSEVPGVTAHKNSEVIVPIRLTLQIPNHSGVEVFLMLDSLASPNTTSHMRYMCCL